MLNKKIKFNYLIENGHTRVEKSRIASELERVESQYLFGVLTKADTFSTNTLKDIFFLRFAITYVFPLNYSEPTFGLKNFHILIALVSDL